MSVTKLGAGAKPLARPVDAGLAKTRTSEASARPAGPENLKVRSSAATSIGPRATLNPAGEAPLTFSNSKLKVDHGNSVPDGGEIPKDETGNRYATLKYVVPGTGRSTTVTGHAGINGRFDVHDHTTHAKVGTLKIADSAATVGVDSAGLKGGARGDYTDRHGVLRDRDGRRVVVASSSRHQAHASSSSTSSRRTERATHSSSPDSDLAYGQYDGPHSGYEGRFGGVTFSSTRNSGDMRRVAEFVAGLPPYFQHTLANAGPITVTFGRAPGGGVGAWVPGRNSVVLDPNHRHVQAGGTNRLLGAAAFEIINAGSERARLGIEADARSGALEQQAQGSGYTPAQLYGREMERLEFRNAQFHRQMMNDAGMGETRANLFGGETQDFETYYAQQVASGHTRSYEDHYNFLRPGPIVMPTYSSGYGGGY